jgi:hypothetical protein
MDTQHLVIDPTSEAAHELFTALLKEHFQHRAWLENCQKVSSGQGSPEESHKLLNECFDACNSVEVLLDALIVSTPKGGHSVQ